MCSQLLAAYSFLRKINSYLSSQEIPHPSRNNMWAKKEEMTTG
jgi:hypothetical protein